MLPDWPQALKYFPNDKYHLKQKTKQKNVLPLTMLSLKPFNLLPKFIRNGGALTGLFLIYLSCRAIVLHDTQESGSWRNGTAELLIKRPSCCVIGINRWSFAKGEGIHGLCLKWGPSTQKADFTSLRLLCSRALYNCCCKILLDYCILYPSRPSVDWFTDGFFCLISFDFFPVLHCHKELPF